MAKLFNFKIFKLNITITLLTVAALALVGFLLYSEYREANKTIITSNTLKGKKVLGKVIKGENKSNDKNMLSTNTELVYESKPIVTNRPTSTAAVISWSQQNNPDSKTRLEMRVYDGGEWSSWIQTASDQDDRKDGTDPKNSSIIVSKDINKVQYRLTMDNTSPAIDLSSVEIETIDSSKGPSLTKKTTWQKITEALGLDTKVAKSRPVGPPINSRLVWGSPEPYGSPGWTPTYQPLNRVIVHHTAVTPSADSSAAVRAIWYYHTYTNGWGDIGYNYLVDQAGNIFQGRFADGNYTEANNVDVVGGHAHGNNQGTTGIAALGDFTNTPPTSSLVHSIGEVAAYKMGPYGLNPAGGETYGGNLLGHRDVGSTACPGATLYSQFSTIRYVASALFPRYYVPPYAWQYVNQHAYTDPARQVPIDLNTTPVVSGRKIYLTVYARNTGSKTWYPDGVNPVRLGTSRNQDRTSSFCDSPSWLSCGRVANIAELSVPPGQVGSFQFTVVIPDNYSISSGVALKEYFSPLAEGVTWFNDPGLYWIFTIPKPYAWQYVNQHAYTDPARQVPIDLNTTPVVSGQTIYLSVEARNTGSKPWTPDGSNPIRLGTSNQKDRLSSFCNEGSWVSCSRAANISQSNVAAGDIGTFDFSIVIPPNNTGAELHHKEYFSPLSEGIVWLNDPGLYWLIRVSP